MKKKDFLHHFMIWSCMAMTAVSSAAVPLSQAQYSSADLNTTIVSPYSDKIKWIFKTENGKLYKRLFNSTTGQWIGDWILVK